MSRVGQKIIEIPKEVKVTMGASSIAVQGARGERALPVPAGSQSNGGGSKRTAERENEDLTALQGTARALVGNGVTGVSRGFSQGIRIVGVGYNADLRGRSLFFSPGYSHPSEFP